MLFLYSVCVCVFWLRITTIYRTYQAAIYFNSIFWYILLMMMMMMIAWMVKRSRICVSLCACLIHFNKQIRHTHFFCHSHFICFVCVCVCVKTKNILFGMYTYFGSILLNCLLLNSNFIIDFFLNSLCLDQIIDIIIIITTIIINKNNIMIGNKCNRILKY